LSGKSVGWKTYVDQRFTDAEQAIAIKQKSDEVALALASSIQNYKDEQHNGLLKVLQEERSTYVTRDQLQADQDKNEILFKTFQDFMTSQIAVTTGVRTYRGVQQDERAARYNSAARATVAVIIAAIAVLSTIVLGVYSAVHK
jgi:hypothetical protein